jgi:hypothetical protein
VLWSSRYADQSPSVASGSGPPSPPCDAAIRSLEVADGGDRTAPRRDSPATGLVGKSAEGVGAARKHDPSWGLCAARSMARAGKTKAVPATRSPRRVDEDDAADLLLHALLVEGDDPPVDERAIGTCMMRAYMGAGRTAWTILYQVPNVCVSSIADQLTVQRRRVMLSLLGSVTSSVP